MIPVTMGERTTAKIKKPKPDLPKLPAHTPTIIAKIIQNKNSSIILLFLF